MINCVQESFLPRFAATSAASYRPGTEPGRSSRDVCHFHSHHQAISQTTTRERPRLAQNHPWASERQGSRITGWSVRAVESQPRCHPRATLPDVGSLTWHQGQSCQYQSGQNGLGMDSKKRREEQASRRKLNGPLGASNPLACRARTWSKSPKPGLTSP